MKIIFFLTLLVFNLTACSTAGPESGTDDAATLSERKPAPEFNLDTFPEGTINSAELEGKVVLVDF